MEAAQFGLLILLVYLGILLLVGGWAARRQHSPADFWVAGRRFGVGMMVVTNTAAMMHGGAILSHVAFSAQMGGVAVTATAAYVAGFAIILFFFARHLRESRSFTLPDYLGDRFDSHLLRAWSAVIVALTSTLYLVAQIRAIGFVLEELLGLPRFYGQLIGTLVFVAYVALGGLLAIAWTNVLQFALMMGSVIFVLPGIYRAAGGWYQVLNRVEEIAPGWTSLKGVEWSWAYLASWYLLVTVAYSTRLELLTKVLAARDHRVARYALPWTLLIVMTFLLCGGLYLGGAARILVWDQISGPDQAFPALIRLTASPVPAALALTGVAAAIMSTTDSLLLMSGAAVAHDLLRRSYDHPRGRVRPEAYYLKMSRLTILAIGLIAFAGSLPDIALILEIVAFALGILASAFFVPLVLGIVSNRVSRAGAIASSIGGGLTAIGWTAATLAGAGWAVALHPVLPGLLCSLVLMVVVCRVTAPVESQVGRAFFDADSGE